MHLILKALFGCNLRCVYCNETSHHHLPARMSLEDVRRMVVSLGAYFESRDPAEPVYFFWQGGEPFLLGPAYFAEVLAIQERVFGESRAWYNKIQTNLTLLDDGWLDLFKRARRRVAPGISFDFYGRDRRTPDGGSTRRTVLANIHRLMREGFRPGIVCMLTRSNVGRLHEIYDFVHRHPVAVRFNQLVNAPDPRGRRRGCGGATRLTNAEYARAMRWLNRRWIDDPESAGEVVNTREMMRQILYGVSSCYFAKECQSWHMTILPDGGAYPCDDRYLPEFRLGNIFTDPVEAVMGSPVRKAWIDRPRHVQEGACRGCDVLQFCNGGCPNHALSYGRGLYGRDPFCSVYRSLFRQLRKILADAGYL